MTSDYLNQWWLISLLIYVSLSLSRLTHWGRVTHICISKLTIIGSDNGLSPERRQAIIWTNAGILLIGPLGTNFSEILIEIQTFSLKKIRLKMSSAKCCSFRLGLNVLTHWPAERCSCNIKSVIFKLISSIFSISCQIALRWLLRPHQWWVNIASGNGLVPEPMLTQIYMSPYGISRRQWVNLFSFGEYGYTVEPLYKGRPRWWPFKGGGLSWGVK